MSSPENLLQLNIYDKVFKGKFLIIGTCVARLYPKIYKKFKEKWVNVVSICLEETHYNQAHSKLVDILGTGNTKKVALLTVDKSPHCTQLHYMSKYLKRNLKVDVEYFHYVISDDQSVSELTIDQINDSKNLARVGKRVVC
jgi:hypothetical protein